ncbi:hypothetical protein M3Y97_01042900 [Aphelenchoides bicaudatus]|nr:hypothetical protein M3Y97_01042900 [Aphelenchoides bicaudatus]
MKSLFAFLFALVLTNAAVPKIHNGDRKYVIKLANIHRAEFAKGETYNDKYGQVTTPRAKRMYKLTYSKKLEKKARKAARACNSNLSVGFLYFVRNSYQIYMQNEYPITFNNVAKYALSTWETMFWASKLTLKDTITGKILFMKQSLIWNETSKYDLDKKTLGDIDIQQAIGTEFGQYAYDKASQIGCFMHICSNITGRWRDKVTELNATFIRPEYPFLVCTYNKKISFGKPIYKKGKKLKCPKGSRPSRSSKGLCTVKGVKEIHK